MSSIKQGSTLKQDSTIKQSPTIKKSSIINEGSGIRHSNFDKYFNQDLENEKESVIQSSKFLEKRDQVSSNIMNKSNNQPQSKMYQLESNMSQSQSKMNQSQSKLNESQIKPEKFQSNINQSHFKLDQSQSNLNQSQSNINQSQINMSKSQIKPENNKREITFFSNIIDPKPTQNRKEVEELSPEKFSRKIESETELVLEDGSYMNYLTKQRNPLKNSSVIKKFFINGKNEKQEEQLQKSSIIHKENILKNLNISSFQKLVKKNDPSLIQLKNSKIINNLDHHLINVSEYDRLLEECKSWGKKFVDPDFPPDSTSLCKDWERLSAKQKISWKKFVWRRADEIFGTEYDVFVQNIEPNDIRQGQLGDCYLLSSLSSLAERPFVVKKIFQPDQKNDYGIYSIWLNVNGAWTNVIIDDYFPCMSEKGGPAFSRGNGNELWVLLLEKAYAKIFGCYHAIEGGNPAVSLRDLTGAPYENRDDVNEDEFWDYIKTNDRAGNIFFIYYICLFFIYF